MFALWLTLALCALAALYAYCAGSWRYWGYWARRGVKHDPPLPLLGNNARGFLLQRSMTQVADELYRRYPGERVVGFYRGTRPELLVRDPDLAKRILVNDFPHFYARGFVHHTNINNIEPLRRHLFFADGDLWKLLRQRMTSAFTSGKLRAMFPLIAERAERLRARTLSAAAAGRPLDAHDLMARYTTDFIGACGFGLDPDCFQDENSAFRKLGTKIFTLGIKDAVIEILKDTFPHTFRHLKYLTRCEKDFMDLIKEVLKQRDYKPSGRNDFIDLMLECRQQGTLVVESIEHVKRDGTPEIAKVELDDELIAAQVFVFFGAGFETSSSATSFTLLNLAHDSEIQKKVQEEIDRVLVKYDNKLSYDAIKEMTYLEWTLKESMRIIPPVGFVFRQCAHQYTIPGTNVTIDPGVGIIISVQSLHNDPEYFDEPEEFRPERFHPDMFSLKNKQAYMPFGQGPRACIGERMALMQSLAGLAALLSRFSVSPVPGTPRWPTIDPRVQMVQALSSDLLLTFNER